MSFTTTLIAVIFVGVVTYAMRAGLILALADAELPTWLVRALRYVAPAVLAALTVTLIADPDAANRGIAWPEVAGLLVAGPIAWKTKNLVITLAAGMAAFWIVLAVS